MSKWAHAENCAWALAFVAIMLMLDGAAKLWAVLPLMFLNIPKQRKPS